MVKSTDKNKLLTWSDEELEDKLDMLREAASLFEKMESEKVAFEKTKN